MPSFKGIAGLRLEFPLRDVCLTRSVAFYVCKRTVAVSHLKVFLCSTHFNFHTRGAFCEQTMVELNHNGKADVKLFPLACRLLCSSVKKSPKERKTSDAMTIYWNHVPTVNLERRLFAGIRRCLLFVEEVYLCSG